MTRPTRRSGPAGPADGAAAPTAPTRRWEMTSQEQDMMARFRRDYLDLLDGRVAKIQRLIETSQIEPAHVALLSLESSSAMVGLDGLAEAVRRLRSALQADEDDALPALAQAVTDQAAAAHRTLGD